MTGPTLVHVNTFRSTLEEREAWDREYRELGYKDFTAFVRNRLNGDERQPRGEEGQPAPPAPTFPPEGAAPAAPHHPNCTCTVCKARNQR